MQAIFSDIMCKFIFWCHWWSLVVRISSLLEDFFQTQSVQVLHFLNHTIWSLFKEVLLFATNLYVCQHVTPESSTLNRRSFCGGKWNENSAKAATWLLILMSYFDWGKRLFRDVHWMVFLSGWLKKWCGLVAIVSFDVWMFEVIYDCIF
jgi:hypothetical protein